MKKIIAIILGAGLIWAYLYFSEANPNALMISDECQVLGIVNPMRESVQGEKFWRGRLHVIEKQIAYELNEPRRRAYLRGLAEKKKSDEIREINERCEYSSEFCPSPDDILVFQLKSESERLAMKAEEIERQKFADESVDRLLVIRRCVREKLNEG